MSAGQGAGVAQRRILSSPMESVQGRTDLSLMTPRAFERVIVSELLHTRDGLHVKDQESAGRPRLTQGASQNKLPASASVRRYPRCSGRCSVTSSASSIYR